MKSTMITTIGRYTIVKLKQDDRITWVACRDYNDSSAEGTRWSSGVSFSSFGETVAFAYGPEKMYRIMKGIQDSYNFDNVLDKMYLLTMHDDLAGNPNMYAVVKTKKDAYDKVRDFMANYLMAEELNWKELMDLDYTHVGENGFFKIEEYTLGDDIVGEE